jgi:hypothetical protein
MYEYGEPWWNIIDREKAKNSEKNLSQCHFVHQKCHIDQPVCKPRPPVIPVFLFTEGQLSLETGGLNKREE